MAQVITSGTNAFSYLVDGVPFPKATAAEVTPNRRGVAISTPFGVHFIQMDGTTINGTPFTAASDIADFYDALADVVNVDGVVSDGGSGDATLADLGNTSDPLKGAALIGYKTRTQANRNADLPDLRDFGVRGNTANDYTDEINDAVAEAKASTNVLKIGKGTYWTAGISDCDQVLLLGDGMGISRLQHIAGNSTPLINVNGYSVGYTAYPFYGFVGLTLVANDDTTDLIYFVGNVDNNVRFSDVQFGAGLSIAGCHGLNMQDYLNINMSMIRWDSIPGCGIRVRNATFGLAHLSIDEFSYDNGTGVVEGFGEHFIYCNAAGASARRGVWNLRNGRIEVNSKLTSVKPARAVFRVLQNSGMVSSGQSQLVIGMDSTICNVATTAKDMKFISSDIGTIGYTQRNSVIYGCNELVGNDAGTSRLHDMMSTTTPYRADGRNNDYGLNMLVSGEGHIIRGTKFNSTDSDTNMTSNGAALKCGDVILWDLPWNTSGRQAGTRPFALKAVQLETGIHFPAAQNLSGTGSTTESSDQLVMTTTLNHWAVPGVRVNIPGAGAAAATLSALIKSVDYVTNTITLGTAASTAVAGATVTSPAADLRTVDMVKLSAGIPASGSYGVGDIVKNSSFAWTGGSVVQEYVCTIAGSPGSFRPTKWLVRTGTTANRPTLTASDVGVTYIDTTLNGDGIPIMWDGTRWRIHRLQATAQTINYAATVSHSLQYHHKITVGTLTGAITFNSPTNIPPENTEVSYAFTQNGTGEHGITWSALHKGAWPTASGTAGQKQTVWGEANGTDVIFKGASGWYS